MQPCSSKRCEHDTPPCGPSAGRLQGLSRSLGRIVRQSLRLHDYRSLTTRSLHAALDRVETGEDHSDGR